MKMEKKIIIKKKRGRMLNYINKLLFKKNPYQQACLSTNRIIKYKLKQESLIFFERRSFDNRMHNLELKTQELKKLTTLLQKEPLKKSDLLNFATPKKIETLLETINENLTK